MVLLILSAASSSSHKIADDLIDHAIDKDTAKKVSKSLAERHFESHGAKWPSAAFSQAVLEAAMRHDAAGTRHGAASAVRSVVLMAMANDMAMRRTVPIFVQSLKVIPTEAAGMSLDRHLVLVCSSDEAADMCRSLGLGSR